MDVFAAHRSTRTLRDVVPVEANTALVVPTGLVPSVASSDLFLLTATPVAATVTR
jgi:hypothetical protein